MTIIVINGPSNGAFINSVHLWDFKYVDNALSFFKGAHKVLLVMRHGNRTVIINTNGKSIGVKLILARMATGVVCNSHASGML